MSTSMKNFVSIYLKFLSIFIIYLILSMLPANAKDLVVDKVVKNVSNKQKILMAVGGETLDIINTRPYGFGDLVNIEQISTNDLSSQNDSFIVIEDINTKSNKI